MTLRTLIPFAVLLSFASCKKEEPEEYSPPPAMKTVDYLVDCHLCSVNYRLPDGQTLSDSASAGNPFIRQFQAAVGTSLHLSVTAQQFGIAIIAVDSLAVASDAGLNFTIEAVVP